MRTIQSELRRVGLSKKSEKVVKKRIFTSGESEKDARKREIEELMGIRRPTYRKHRGSFRSK